MGGNGQCPKVGYPLPPRLHADYCAERSQIEAQEGTQQCHAELVDLYAEALSGLPDVIVGYNDSHADDHRGYGANSYRANHTLLVENRAQAVQRRANHQADDTEPS